MKEALNFLVSHRVKINTLFFLGAILCPRMDIGWWVAGLLLALIGLLVRLWAGGFIKKDEEVTKQGPYRMLRHPLYLGSFLIFLGVGVGGFHPILTLIFLPIFIITHGFAAKMEEERLIRKFGSEYIRYMWEVPPFLPRKINFDVKGWKVKMAFKNTSPILIIVIVLYFLMIFLRLSPCQIFDRLSTF